MRRKSPVLLASAVLLACSGVALGVSPLKATFRDTSPTPWSSNPLMGSNPSCSSPISIEGTPGNQIPSDGFVVAVRGRVRARSFQNDGLVGGRLDRASLNDAQAYGIGFPNAFVDGPGIRPSAQLTGAAWPFRDNFVNTQFSFPGTFDQAQGNGQAITDGSGFNNISVAQNVGLYGLRSNTGRGVTPGSFAEFFVVEFTAAQFDVLRGFEVTFDQGVADVFVPSTGQTIRNIEVDPATFFLSSVPSPGGCVLVLAATLGLARRRRAC